MWKGLTRTNWAKELPFCRYRLYSVPACLFSLAYTLVWRAQAQFRGKQRSCLVHCKAGHGRSPLLVACFLVATAGMSADEYVFAAVLVTSVFESFYGCASFAEPWLTSPSAVGTSIYPLHKWSPCVPFPRIADRSCRTSRRKIGKDRTRQLLTMRFTVSVTFCFRASLTPD